jgi:hypothetical protein
MTIQHLWPQGPTSFLVLLRWRHRLQLSFSGLPRPNSGHSSLSQNRLRASEALLALMALVDHLILAFILLGPLASVLLSSRSALSSCR